MWYHLSRSILLRRTDCSIENCLVLIRIKTNPDNNLSYGLLSIIIYLMESVYMTSYQVKSIACKTKNMQWDRFAFAEYWKIFSNAWGSLHSKWSSLSSHFQEECSNLQSSTVLKMQSSSSTNVAIDNLHSSASQTFFTSSFFNAGWNKCSFSSSC